MSKKDSGNATIDKIISFCSALWRKTFNFYASQSAFMNSYFTCQKLSKFTQTCFTTTKETAWPRLIWPTRYVYLLSFPR